jgi:hypothetical protein
MTSLVFSNGKAICFYETSMILNCMQLILKLIKIITGVTSVICFENSRYEIISSTLIAQNNNNE